MIDRLPGIRRAFRLGVAKREIDEELAFHFEKTVEELTRAGLPPEEAQAEARRRFGSEQHYRRELERLDRRAEALRRWARGWGNLATDARRALRGMAAAPGFTAGVVLTFALGIGANATIFGIVDRLLLRPPPHVVQPEGVKRIWTEMYIPFMGSREIQEYLTYPDYLGFARADAFSGVAAFARRELTVGRGEAARRMDAHLVTGNFFSLLGTRPAAGRLFGPEDDRVGAPGVAVISHGMWEREYGGDREILGRTLDFGYGPYTIVGVAPRGFTGVNLEPVEFWVPLVTANAQMRPDLRWRDSRNQWWLRIVARLEPGVTPETAAAEATGLYRQGRAEDLAEEGDWDREARALVAPLLLSRGPLASGEAAVTRWLAWISLIVLLIACANVANLLLARSIRRQRETGIRLALGSSRGRLLGQVITESLLLALLGGTAALLLTRWGGVLLQRALLPDLAWGESALEPRVAALVVALTALAGLMAGLLPALQSSRPDLVASLRSGARGASSPASRTRDALTVVQAALSVVLLVGAGLFVRSLGQVNAVDLGIDPRGVLLVESTFDRELPEAAQVDYYRRAAERLRAVPGVSGVSPDITIPFWSVSSYELRVPGLDSVPSLSTGGPALHAVSHEYFDFMGLSVRRGRALLATDGPGAPPVVVVNETMARVLWPGQEAIGKCLVVDWGGPEESPCAEVVGIVEDANRFELVEDPSMDYYLSFEQSVARDAPTALLVGVEGEDPERLIPAVQRELLAVEPGLRHAEVTPMGSFLVSQARAWTLGAAMFGAFGVLALLVAAIGLYSVLAFGVAQRTQELGIRAALGASRESLVGLVLGKGMRLVGAGVAIGLGIAFLAGPRVEPLLFRVSPRDPLVLGGVALVLLLVAALASGAPAWRATRVDPSVALRSE